MSPESPDREIPPACPRRPGIFLDKGTPFG